MSTQTAVCSASAYSGLGLKLFLVGAYTFGKKSISNSNRTSMKLSCIPAWRCAHTRKTQGKEKQKA